MGASAELPGMSSATAPPRASPANSPFSVFLRLSSSRLELALAMFEAAALTYFNDVGSAPEDMAVRRDLFGRKSEERW